jgi:Mg-chelatase subunit ChlD
MRMPSRLLARIKAIHGSNWLEDGEKVNLDKNKLDNAEEMTGKLSKQSEHDKLMNSVLENDKDTIDDGKLLNNAINSGLGAFNPDMLFEQLIKDYSMAKHIYGEKIIHSISGYDPKYIEKNVNIPEFRRELKQKIAERIESMKDEGLIDRGNTITDKGYELASLVLYTEELDKLTAKGLTGEKISKKQHIYGDRQDVRNYKKHDSYKNIAVRSTLKTAVKRGHFNPEPTDFKSFTRESRGTIHIVYALDSSGSMKGQKIENCKKAGVALAFRAIQEKDKVGLMIFGKDVKEVIEATSDFPLLLSAITKVRAFHETDIAKTIRESVEIFPADDIAKHLILLTDAVPTVGEKPEKDTLEAASIAKGTGITISVIGINLDEKGKKLAEKIVEIGEGKLYSAKETEDLDSVVLEDYFNLQ